MQKSTVLIGILLMMTLSLGSLAACSPKATPQTSGTTTTTSPSVPLASSTQPVAINQLISPEDAKNMLANNPNILLLDVRTAEEYAAGHIPDSVLLPYDQLKARADELPADKTTPIIVYCRSGNRSAVAAGTLAGLGYTEIYDLGGIQDWPYDIVKGET